MNPTKIYRLLVPDYANLRKIIANSFVKLHAISHKLSNLLYTTMYEVENW